MRISIWDDVVNSAIANQAVCMGEKPKKIRKRYYVEGEDVYFTQREHDCVLELKKGKTNASIAEALGISRRTVEVYIDRMRKRVNIAGKQQLVDFLEVNTLVETKI